MVGAITTLIVIVAVFLAYNANNGLPFVPIYRVSAEISDAARLGPNNEVRIGGNRVGVVESIDTVAGAARAAAARPADGSSASTRRQAQPEARQERRAASRGLDFRVRYRSSFGLKYLEIDPRHQRDRACPPAATLPLVPVAGSRSSSTTSTTPSTRDPREQPAGVLQGFGDAFAARGTSLNEAISALNPLFANLRPVSAGARGPDHAARPLLPRARRRRPDRRAGRRGQRRAVHQRRDHLRRDLIRPAGAAGHDLRRPARARGRASASLPVQRPFLADFAEFSRLLRPGVRGPARARCRTSTRPS